MGISLDAWLIEQTPDRLIYRVERGGDVVTAVLPLPVPRDVEPIAAAN